GAGIGAGTLLYLRWRDVPELLAARFQRVYRLLRHAYYVDEVYDAIFVDGFRRFCRLFWKVDENVVDGAVNGTADVTMRVSNVSDWNDIKIVDGAVNRIADIIQGCSASWRYVQTGVVQNYLMAMALGIFLIVSLYMVL
ncbi:MAG: NADH-quinone oxidoreductase subunit L, partial [Candidatus Methylomirabilales bacterium]